MSASVIYAVFPGPVRQALEIARSHGYVVPGNESALAACYLLAHSGLLTADVEHGRFIAADHVGAWLDCSKMPERKIAVAP